MKHTPEVFIRKKKPRHCDECGENKAHYKFTYLYGPNPRSNPASSAYGRDDCSWCSDEDVFICKECAGSYPSSGKHKPEGCVECGRFENGERFAHIFMKTVEEPYPELLEALREVVRQYEGVRAAEAYPSIESASTRRAKEIIAKARVETP